MWETSELTNSAAEAKMDARPFLYSDSSKPCFSCINFLCCQRNSSPSSADYGLTSVWLWCPCFPFPSASPCIPTPSIGGAAAGCRDQQLLFSGQHEPSARRVLRKEGREVCFPPICSAGGGCSLPRALPLLVRQLAQYFLMLITVNHMLSTAV